MDILPSWHLIIIPDCFRDIAACSKFISHTLTKRTSVLLHIYRFAAASIPQMITPAACMRDGIRSTRINKFAKALLLYVAHELYDILLVRCIPREGK